MSCDDELDLVGTQLGHAMDAEKVMDAAWTELEAARAGFNDTLAGWVEADDDEWADAEEAAKEAWDDLQDAKEAFDQAEENFNEEMNWLDFAQETYCECKREDPNP